MRDLTLTRRGLSMMALALGGCASTISQDGPARVTVVNGASIRIGDVGNQEKLAYALVSVSSGVLAQLAAVDRPLGFSPGVIETAPKGSGIGIGDYVAITIFESGAGGLFVPAEPGTRSGNYITLPNQQVDAAGNILVPYAGTLHVTGMSPQGVARLIQNRLGGRALEPQAVVSIVDRRANAVAVTGDVATSSHFVLDPGGERLMGAIARAGGSKYPPYESVVTLQRGGITERVFISDVMRDPRQNIEVEPGDSIFVTREQKYFLALGALGPGQYLGLVNRRLPFEDSHISMADAIAKVGGLSDDRANSRAVFMYRFEPRERLASFGVQLPDNLPPTLPTIYYLDLSQAAGYFFASQFPIRNEDLIYVSNAPITDLAKFLAVILPAAYSAANFKTL